MTRVTEAEETAKKVSVEMESLKKNQVEELMKLDSILTKIEDLKKEVHLSQSEVASLTKQVESPDVHQRLPTEALELANIENIALKEQVGELNSQISGLVKEMEVARKKA